MQLEMCINSLGAAAGGLSSSGLWAPSPAQSLQIPGFGWRFLQDNGLRALLLPIALGTKSASMERFQPVTGQKCQFNDIV